MVTRLTDYTKQFWSLLSTDDTDPLVPHNGDEAILIDRNERYVFDEENQIWRHIPMSGGGGGTLTTKTITENGTYSAEDDNADGYSSVTVGVPVVGAVGESTSAGQYMVIPKVEGYSNFIAWVSDVDASYLSTGGRALMAYRIAVFSSTAVLSMKCTNTTYPVNSVTGTVHTAAFVEETSAQIKVKFPNANTTGILPDGHTIKYLWF